MMILKKIYHFNSAYMNQATTSKTGYICPVRKCSKKKNRKFTAKGLVMHLEALHPGEFEKRLRLKKV